MDLSCEKCGGPLPIEAARAPVVCQFCGTTSVPPPEVVVVGRPIAIPTGVETETRLPCPRCASWLDEKPAGQATIHACRFCAGSWLDAATVTRVRSARDPEIEATARRIAGRGTEGAAPDRTLATTCPVCRNRMQRNVCTAHGSWFDGGDADELQRFLSGS